MQLSVVILNYNVRWFLQQCLESVEKAISGMDAEIIVVDNNSPDDSCEMVRTFFPNVILIENPENSGFPKGNNIGVARASGKHICILNPDTVVAEDTFTQVIAFAESKLNCGIVGVKLIDGTGKFLPESKRGIPTPWTALTKVAGLYKLSESFFGKYYASHLSQDESGEVEILVGAFMILERELYLKVGGFDENCFMYSDDIDLSYTVLKSGRRNHYFAGTTVIHYKGESTVRDAAYMRNFRDAMNFFYKKHFRVSPFFDFVMIAGASVFSLMKRNKAVSKPVIKRLVTNSHNLQDMIAQTFAKPVVTMSGKFSPQRGDCVVFDATKQSYASIISDFQSFASDDITFRIANPAAGFVIGSDSSDGRGEVVLLNGNTRPMV